jgi:hypothetical protein
LELCLLFFGAQSQRLIGLPRGLAIPDSPQDDKANTLKTLEFVRCNPNVALRLTSGGHEDKDYVITPANKLFKGMANVDTSWRYS